MRPANFPHNKARKQTEALARNTEWAKLTPMEKLRALDLRPGKCIRQRVRIQEQAKV